MCHKLICIAQLHKLNVHIVAEAKSLFGHKEYIDDKIVKYI